MSRLMTYVKTTSTPKRLAVAVIVGVAVIAGASAIAIAATGTASHGSAPAGTRAAGPIQNAGTPVSQSMLTAGDTAVLSHIAADSNGTISGVYLLAKAHGAAFYRLANADGSDCYAVGPEAPTHGLFGQVGCPTDFPGQTPIVDFTLGQANRVMGIAADSVSEIALLDSAGRTVGHTQVVDNVFSLPSANRPNVAKLVALDAAGNQLYSEPEYPQKLVK